MSEISPLSSVEPVNASARNRPKGLMDLPSEVIADILNYLIPDRSDVTTFKEDESNAGLIPGRAAGWKDFVFLAGNEPSTRDALADQHYQRRWEPREYAASLLPTLAQPERNDSEHSFANFAATCKQFAYEARALYAWRKFPLTVSNCGITFEGIRDPAPLQTFSVIPGDLGSIIPKWAMVDLKRHRIVKVPRTKIPGNDAFGAFSLVFDKLETLRLYVDIDLESGNNDKTRFFLGQIGRFMLSRASKDISLSTIDVQVSLGYHGLIQAKESSTTDSLFPVLTSKVPPEARYPGYSEAEMVSLEVSEVLATLTGYLLKVQAKLDTYARLNATGAGTRSLQIKVAVHGDGSPGMDWDMTSLTTSFPSGGDSESNHIKLLYVGFEDFCKDVQRRVYGSKECAENVVDRERQICELGTPVRKVSDARTKAGKQGRKRGGIGGKEVEALNVQGNKRQCLG